jgi:hypothetical protein
MHQMQKLLRTVFLVTVVFIGIFSCVGDAGGTLVEVVFFVGTLVVFGAYKSIPREPGGDVRLRRVWGPRVLPLLPPLPLRLPLRLPRRRRRRRRHLLLPRCSRLVVSDG